MKNENLAIILGRQEFEFPQDEILASICNLRILITGGKGSIGLFIGNLLKNANIDFKLTDIDSMDVTSLDSVTNYLVQYRPTHILHLAADKHAPDSEVNPESTFRVNVLGTLNVLKGANLIGAKLITASTCKACDPETVYGSTKLIAERMTLNEGGSVARFYNVIETSGNVFRIWEGLNNGNIPATSCYRYFITLKEASFLLLLTLIKSVTVPGRYSIAPGKLRFMPDVARQLYPNKNVVIIPPRRGDRICELFTAGNEVVSEDNHHLLKISSPYDKFL